MYTVYPVSLKFVLCVLLSVKSNYMYLIVFLLHLSQEYLRSKLCIYSNIFKHNDVL